MDCNNVAKGSSLQILSGVLVISWCSLQEPKPGLCLPRIFLMSAFLHSLPRLRRFPPASAACARHDEASRWAFQRCSRSYLRTFAPSLLRPPIHPSHLVPRNDQVDDELDTGAGPATAAAAGTSQNCESIYLLVPDASCALKRSSVLLLLSSCVFSALALCLRLLYCSHLHLDLCPLGCLRRQPMFQILQPPLPKRQCRLLLRMREGALCRQGPPQSLWRSRWRSWCCTVRWGCGGCLR